MMQINRINYENTNRKNPGFNGWGEVIEIVDNTYFTRIISNKFHTAMCSELNPQSSMYLRKAPPIYHGDDLLHSFIKDIFDKGKKIITPNNHGIAKELESDINSVIISPRETDEIFRRINMHSEERPINSYVYGDYILNLASKDGSNMITLFPAEKETLHDSSRVNLFYFA